MSTTTKSGETADARPGRRILGLPVRLVDRWRGAEAGQTTAEYALVILGAAAIATLLITWAKGGAIGDLFDSVIQQIIP